MMSYSGLESRPALAHPLRSISRLINFTFIGPSVARPSRVRVRRVALLLDSPLRDAAPLHARLGEELVAPVYRADGHEGKGRPDERHELVAPGRGEADFLAVVGHRVDDLLPADRRRQVPGEQAHHGEEREGEVGEDEHASGLRQQEERREGRQHGEPGEAGGEDVQDAHGHEQAGDLVELLLEVVGESEVIESDFERPDSQLVVEQCRDVKVSY